MRENYCNCASCGKLRANEFLKRACNMRQRPLDSSRAATVYRPIWRDYFPAWFGFGNNRVSQCWDVNEACLLYFVTWRRIQNFQIKAAQTHFDANEHYAANLCCVNAQLCDQSCPSNQNTREENLSTQSFINTIKNTLTIQEKTSEKSGQRYIESKVILCYWALGLY